MSFLYRFATAALVRWFSGLKWTDFMRIVGMVEEAAEKWKKPPTLTEAEKAAINQERAGFVITFIRRVFPGIPTGAVNFLNELAVMFSRRS
jgi:hypothetical protein